MLKRVLGGNGTSDIVSFLRSCAASKNLEAGRQAHSEILQRNEQGDTLLGNLLIQMYNKCGCVNDAVSVFHSIKIPNIISWTLLISAYAQNGQRRKALCVLKKIDLEGVKITRVTYVTLLSAVRTSEEGRSIHARVDLQHSDTILGTAFLSMYGRCGNLEDARLVFNAMPKDDVITWNAMLSAYSQHGFGMEALELYGQMKAYAVERNRCTYLSILVACSACGALQDGREAHLEFMRMGIPMDVPIGNTLINMYGKCGCLEEAKRIFDEEMREKNQVTWSAIVGAYVGQDRFVEAVGLYRLMNLEGGRPNEITFLSILGGCSTPALLGCGRQVHERMAAGGEIDMNVGKVPNALVCMYSKCGSLEDARRVFDEMPQRDVVSWTVLITAYAQEGHSQQALELFKRMDLEGTAADEIAYLSVLEAISNMEDLQQGKVVHEHLMENKLKSSRLVETKLINMYGRCGSVEDAREVFEETFKDVASCTSMISAYAQNGYGKEALFILKKMDLEGIKPNNITLISSIDACSEEEDLNQGCQLHARVVAADLDLEHSVVLGTALINLYHKCGSLSLARRSFDNLHEYNVVSWNSIIEAYARRGHIEESLNLLCKMDHSGLSPDVVSFTFILFGCNHAGLVEKAISIFNSMLSDHGIQPVMDIYGCMVDLLGRAGHLDMVESLLQDLPFPPSGPLWMSMLGACRTHRDLKRGLRAAEGLDPNHPSAYILTSNLYTEDFCLSDDEGSPFSL